MKATIDFAAWAAVVLCCIAVGCGKSGPATGTVSGDVKFRDAAYTDASLIFLSMETGQGGSVNINEQGKFSLADPLPVGTYKVYLAPKIEDNPYDEPKPVSIDQTVPQKYWNEATTDIEVPIEAGENVVVIDLTG